MGDVLGDKRAAVAESHGAKAPSGAAEWLHLMAAPTFAVMALVTGMSGDGTIAMLCSQQASPFGSMAAMYALMSTFHLAPWLKLFSKRRIVAVNS